MSKNLNKTTEEDCHINDFACIANLKSEESENVNITNYNEGNLLEKRVNKHMLNVEWIKL